MMQKIYIITDLGPGDGGKGGVVHKISHMKRACIILKAGGAQGSHGVRTSTGQKFNFRQWGCGTLEGVHTHITSRMITSPTLLLQEAQELRYQVGVHNPFDLLTIDGSCLCATAYHESASHLKELARGHNARGTIGSGIGDAFRDSTLYPDQVIRFRDLSGPHIRDLLAAVRERKQKELAAIMQGDFLPEDQALVEEEVSFLHNDELFERILTTFKEASELVQIEDLDVILNREGVGVLETSHGILTDNMFGFHPHTSAIRTLPGFNQAMLRDAGYQGKIVNIGVSRAYGIRHGAGPMPTADPEMNERLLPGSNKDENRYQGKVRVGPMDLVLLRYAIDVCGGPTAFDGLAITWFDQIQANCAWDVCDSYDGTDDHTFFTPSGGIKVYDGPNQLLHQQQLGEALVRCQPHVERYEPTTERCVNLLAEKLNVPVRMISVGPTEAHKILC